MVAAAANDSRYSISVGINLSHRLRLIPFILFRRSSISVLHPDLQIRSDFLVAISVLITKERDALELSSCRNVEHVGRIDDFRLRVVVVELQRNVVGSCSAVADNSLAYHFLSGNSDCCSSFNLNTAVDNQFGSKFAVADLQQDGYAAGELKSINIAGDGTVVASYSNNITRAEAQLALTNFRNPQGLTAVGGNNWVESADSGAPVDGKPGSGSFGTLRAGALGESNVDLTAELVNMMTAQRAYQANAQTIKTQDQVMSTLVNLR